eukprot:scaffold115661_cov34-Tisochrysis_lutea.AAC.4
MARLRSRADTLWFTMTAKLHNVQTRRAAAELQDALTARAWVRRLEPWRQAASTRTRRRARCAPSSAPCAAVRVQS